MEPRSEIVPQSEQLFSTFEDASDFIEGYAQKHGIVLILCNTSKLNGYYCKACYVCEKHGQYGGKKPEHKTKKTDCPFKIGLSYRRRVCWLKVTRITVDGLKNI